MMCYLFFFNDTATTEIYTLSLHDALPISNTVDSGDIKNNTVRSKDLRNNNIRGTDIRTGAVGSSDIRDNRVTGADVLERSEEHTSELQSRQYLVCRLLLEKKKINTTTVSI